MATPSSGVVKWIDPPGIRSSRRRSFNYAASRSCMDTSTASSGNSNNPEKVINGDVNDFRPSKNDESPEQVIIDVPLCKIVCTLVEQHLIELNEHQCLIKRARSELLIHNQQVTNSSATNRTDSLKLKLRDEQTKAIETIKQLTNYLKELTSLERLCQSPNSNAKHDVIDKLSSVRTNIIQALNDFVLSNGDIDIPLNDSEDNCEYDMCLDAKTISQRDCLSRNKMDNKNTPDPQKGSSPTIDNKPINAAPEDTVQMNEQMLVKVDLNIHELEQRRKDVQKLERETEELRRLFSDFFLLVKAQSEQVDTIEDNIVITTQRIREGHNNINKAMRGLTVIIPVTGCIAGALIGGPLGLIIGGKVGGITVGCASSLLGLISTYGVQRCVTTNDKMKDH